ncbi:MAG TPA: ABC transporter substrate-binding protein [Sphingomonas sp.]|nr:ABC transporter substrate-binding protein [Sphingomonas sp.]
MIKVRSALLALGIASGVLLPNIAGPALAAVDTSDPQRFVSTLTADGFEAMRTGNREAAKAKFRTLLSTNVAVDMIGDRLIRRWLPTISPAQRAAYKAALPGYVVGTYADRLFEYANAKVRVVRAQPTAGGGADVFTQVTKPGAQPIPATWSVVNVGGAWKVLNLNVAGINVAMAQAADFDSVIQRQGFDSLVKMMKARG